MDYFSGLRKAFDSIESEMTRSLVGNNKEEPPVEPQVIVEEDLSKEDAESHSSQDMSVSRDDWGTNWEDTPPMKSPKKSSSAMSLSPGRSGSAPVTSSGGRSSNPVAAETTPNSNSSAKNTAPSGSVTSKLESLSREELIKYIKKQAQMVRKVKLEMEELNREVATLRKQAAEKPQESSADDDVVAIEDLRAEKDGALLELSTLKSASDALHQELTNEKDELQRKVAELESDVVSRNQQLLDCQEEISELSSKHEAAVDEGNKMRQQVESVTRSADQELISQRDELQTKVASLETKVTSLETKANSLENDVVVRDRQLLEYQEKIKELSRKHEVAVDEGNSLRQQVELVAKSADQELTADHENGELQTKVTSLETKVTSLENDVVVRDQQLLECQEKIEELSRKHEVAMDDNTTLKQHVELYTKSAHCEDQLRDEVRDVSVRWSESQQECQELTRRLTDTEKEKTSIQEKLQTERSSVEMLTAEFEKLKLTTHHLESDREDLTTKCNGMVKEKEGLREMVEILESSKNTLEMEVTSLNGLNEKLQAELAEIKQSLNKERDTHSSTKQKLDTAQKGVKASSLMDLELADYQRTVQSLENDISSRDAQLIAAAQDASKLQETIVSLRSQLDEGGQQRLTAEDKVSKMKGLLVKTKKELAESKKNEEKQNETIQQLQSQLETSQQQIEQSKMDSADVLSRLQSIEQDSSSSKETTQKLIRTLEQKIASLQSELTATQTTLADCQTEYNSYKVRAQSVLKQQQRKTTGNSEISDQTDQLQVVVAQLKTELKQANENLSAILSEHDELSAEHDSLTSRHDKLLGDMEASETKWRQKLHQTEQQCLLKLQQQDELVEQLRNENILTSTAFKEQLRLAQQDHHKMEDTLRKQLIDKQILLDQLEEDAAKKEVGVANSLQERSQGEGMDQSELDSLSAKSDENSLQQLLTSNHGSTGRNEVNLKRMLQNSNSRSDHLTELLREREAECQQMTSQNKVLKEEIRRLERNQLREKEVADLEYLKNVVLKFIHTSGAEQRQLVPIITTLLKLSPKEKDYVLEITKGNTNKPPPDIGTETRSMPMVGTNKGMMSYVHRWTGY